MLRTRGDREHLARLERAASDMHGRAQATTDPVLRAEHERNAARLDALVRHAQRRPVGIGLWSLAIVLVILPWAIGMNLGLGWWGVVPSMLIALLLLRRHTRTRRRASRGIV